MKTVSKKKQKRQEQESSQLSTSPPSASGRASTSSSSSKEAVTSPFGVSHPSKGTPNILDDDATLKKYLECEGRRNCLEFGLHFVHRPLLWSNFYGKQNAAVKRSMRALIQIQTIQAILSGKYFLEPSEIEGQDSTEIEKLIKSKLVLLDKKKMLKSAQLSVKYESEHKYTVETALGTKSNSYKTQLFVVKSDCLEVALHFKKRIVDANKEPLVLDMASMTLPGGGWKTASAAQEENLHRRTNLLMCLEDPYRMNPSREWDYPIPQFGGVYVPNVTVFRGSEAQGYPFLDKPEFVSIVAVSALKMPPTETDPNGEEVLDKKLSRDTLRKIEAIFNIALENGHDILVLSALGCGAYMNPPRHIARLFRTALQSKKYQNAFRVVAFAVIDAPHEHRVCSTASIFSEVFETELMIIRDNEIISEASSATTI